MPDAPSLSVGIEEEYLLVDPQTRDLLANPPAELWTEAREHLGDRVSPELLRAQIEVGTEPHYRIADVGKDLCDLRATLGRVATAHGARILASSTHPFALWWEQLASEGERYQMLTQDLGMVAQRMVICGMHVHVGIEDPDTRIDLMNQVVYFLPHLLALSTSSPFWGGRNTGLKSYRMNVFRSLPRTGLPGHFESWAEYERHVAVLVNAGLIEDATKIWWDIRPSHRYPTLEMRISDICTRWEDAVTIAALYQSILHMLFRLRRSNQRWRRYANMLISENIWRAQRYGAIGSLVDYGKGVVVPFAELVDEIIELIYQDADELGCVTEVERARTIVREGTSSRRQLSSFAAAIERGDSDEDALKAVVDELIVDTMAGT